LSRTSVIIYRSTWCKVQKTRSFTCTIVTSSDISFIFYLI
jgi:hypothetical protein